MAIKKFLNFIPKIDETAYIDETATIIGRVIIGKNVSIWPNAVLRGDINEIKIGDNTNVQDGVVMHVTDELNVEIGSNVTIGHLAMIHGAKVGDNSLIGIGAIILDNAVIGKNTIVAAGTVVPPKMNVPDGVLVMGAPATIKRELTQKEIEGIFENAKEYVKLIKDYKQK